MSDVPPRVLLTIRSGWIGTLLAKIRLAQAQYEALPNAPPQECFIVTAATRGHRRWVGSWFDPQRERLVNRQLLRLWRFEALLRSRLPRVHALLRRVYNRVGPPIARAINAPWRADLVYLLLKPLELLAAATAWLAGEAPPGEK